jgi:MFS family permease
MIFAMLSGFGMMAQTTITNTIIQTTVAQDMRGRVISFFAMAYFGLQPLGSLLIGMISQHIGAPATLLSEGIAALVIVGIFWKYLREKEPLPEPSGHIVEDGALPADEELPAMPVTDTTTINQKTWTHART